MDGVVSKSRVDAVILLHNYLEKSCMHMHDFFTVVKSFQGLCDFGKVLCVFGKVLCVFGKVLRVCGKVLRVFGKVCVSLVKCLW